MKITSFLLLLFTFFLSYSQSNAQKSNQNSKEKEEKYFISLMDKLLSENQHSDNYTSSLSAFDSNRRQELGFNAYRYNYWVYGNDIEYHFDIFICDKKIVEIEIIVPHASLQKLDLIAQENKQVAELINKYWSRELVYNSYKKEEEKQLKYKVFDEVVYNGFLSTVTQYLGKQENIVIPANQKENYELLTSPFVSGVFGESCGEVSSAPISRIAINEIKEKNPELLRNIIKGFSPTGRVYAIVALLELAKEGEIKLLDSDEELIEKVLDIYILIDTCNGCLGSSIMVTELFRQGKYRNLLLDNQILMLRRR